MARRPNLAAVDLKDTGKPADERDDGKTAQTMRLPSEYWRRLRVLAAMRDTTMVGLVQVSLDELFKKLSAQERAALGM
jgi:hypothetical protein